MSLARLLLGVAALAGLPAYAGPGDKYTIDFPKDWSAPVLDPDGKTTEARAPQSMGDVWCRANSNDMPSLADSTQAELNTQHAALWSAQTWAGVLSEPVDKIQISDGASTQVDGHLVQEVTMVFAEDVFGAKVTARLVSHVLVGRMVGAACFTRSETFDGVKDLFEKTVTSLKPVG
jgi:hypothetical protein